MEAVNKYYTEHVGRMRREESKEKKFVNKDDNLHLISYNIICDGV